MNPPPAHGAQFEEGVKVTPLGSNRYSGFLRNEWCIGTVPHGGYTMAVLYRLALVHYAHAHPTHYKEPATPISMQLSFLRRTSAGPVVFTVEDMKLGLRTSSIHVTVQQAREKKSPTDKDQLEVKMAGYITVSPASTEVGISSGTDWTLHPPAIPGSGPQGRPNFSTLAQTGHDGELVKLDTPFPNFRKAAQQLELYGAQPGRGKNGIVDQWSRLAPGGQVSRWTNEGVAFLVDMFPMALEGFDQMTTNAASSDERQMGPSAKYWYPTVTLNVDFKKRLPASGVEWLYSRVVTKEVRDGRTDLDVTVLDQDGQVVALSTQIGLVVSASRNIGRRSKKL